MKKPKPWRIEEPPARLVSEPAEGADIRVEAEWTAPNQPLPSVLLIRPLTDRAKGWLDERIAAEAWQWLEGALAVEVRYVDLIVEGARREGLVVSTAVLHPWGGVRPRDGFRVDEKK